MKIITFIITLAICVPATAVENWYPVGKQGAKTYVGKGKKSICQQSEGQDCFEITGKDLRFYEIKTVSTDDTSKPIWKSSYSTESCGTFAECEVVGETKVCDDEPEDTYRIVENLIMPGYSIHCTRVTGYEQVESKTLVLNESTRDQLIAEDLAKVEAKSAIDAVKKQMECGKTVQASMAIRNVKKGLTTDQVNTFVQTYSTVKNLLDAGALKTAKAQLQSIDPDGTITTAEDKTAILGLIDTCIGE